MSNIPENQKGVQSGSPSDAIKSAAIPLNDDHKNENKVQSGVKDHPSSASTRDDKSSHSEKQK